MRIPRLLDLVAFAAALAALVLATWYPLPALPAIKAIPAALWAVSLLWSSQPGRMGMAVGFALAALGDFLLASGGSWFLPGAMAFAGMQVLYSISFWRKARRVRRPWIDTARRAAVFALPAAVLMILAWPRLGALAGPMAAYAGLLTLMASGGWATGSRWLGLGAALFFVSDALILAFRAWPVPFSTEIPVLVPYYLGQYLILRGSRD